jgi:hypothetical protein
MERFRSAASTIRPTADSSVAGVFVIARASCVRYASTSSSSRDKK